MKRREDSGEENRSYSYGHQCISSKDIAAVSETLKGDWITGGPKVREFEEALAEYCGAKHCIAVSNGTAALHVSALALDIQKGDVALTSPLTFLASANGILYCGGRPDFVDIDPDTLCLSPGLLEDYCKRKGAPKAVVAVSFAGIPADLPSLRQLADRYGFKLVEDAAHALGSSYKYEEKSYRCASCAHSDLAVLSFHPVKNITTGEGGAVLTNDDALARRLRLYAVHGIERDPEKWVGLPGKPMDSSKEYYGPWYHEMQVMGFNYRITDFQCALGLSQLSRIGEFKRRRQELAGLYGEKLKVLADRGLIRLPPWPEESDPCFHLYVLQCLGGAKERHRLFQELCKRRIFPQVHYIPVHLQPFYRKAFGYKWGDFPEAESYYERALSLPLYPDLTGSDVEYISGVITEVLENP
ncbi:MAG: UDP-4-amino-4,6-dideoxy-N-acetyl-beta-L-altrosamine transaminase [Deltaproteobacteria bacterium]|nr:UDP-4-amino-4,6-dideoxy-N-acetyl-beta-L-altrosamine transaminase [Deltaproteobacteria bacterium]